MRVRDLLRIRIFKESWLLKALLSGFGILNIFSRLDSGAL